MPLPLHSCNARGSRGARRKSTFSRSCKGILVKQRVLLAQVTRTGFKFELMGCVQEANDALLFNHFCRYAKSLR